MCQFLRQNNNFFSLDGSGFVPSDIYQNMFNNSILLIIYRGIDVKPSHKLLI